MSAFPKSSLVAAVSQFQESMSPLAAVASQFQESMSPLAAVASQFQESMSPLAAVASQFQESMSPLAAVASQFQESMSPLAAVASQFQESMSPLAAVASQFQESMSPLAAVASQFQESMSPLAAVASQFQESMSPLAAVASQFQESMSPLAAVASQFQESMSPLAAVASQFQESMSPLAAVASQFQESMSPLANQLSWIEQSEQGSFVDNYAFHVSQIHIDCKLGDKLPEKTTVEKRRKLRFRILCAYYIMFHRSESLLLHDIRFKNSKIDEIEIRAATIWLIKSELLEGTVTESNNSLFPNVKTISNHGIARVERKIIISTDKKTNSNIHKANSKIMNYAKKYFANRAAMFIYNKVIDLIFQWFGHG